MASLYWPHSFPSKNLVFILFLNSAFFFFFCNNSRSGIHCVSIRVKVQGSRLGDLVTVTVNKTGKPQGPWNSRSSLSKSSQWEKTVWSAGNRAGRLNGVQLREPTEVIKVNW